MKVCNKKQWDNFVKEWVNKAWDELTDANTKWDYLVNRFERTVILVNKRTGKVSIAKCHPQDTFTVREGIAVAFAKLHGVEIPKVLE